ncbi:hypothetical protein T484DRAFT_1835939 [Baffinella frigidus]|nr:hypothetical protein T484DRAFT_1835939 [Cryptophyta sp. CCMP2293]
MQLTREWRCLLKPFGRRGEEGEDGQGGEEENEAKQKIEEHKGTYKDMFTRLRGLKAEIEQIQVCCFFYFGDTLLI